MGYSDGWAALNLEMPACIPRTEYSAPAHWDLVSTVTGSRVGKNSTGEELHQASKDFMKAWDFSFIWNIMVDRDWIKGRRTSMGHAEYAKDGTDRDDMVYCPFVDPEEVLAYDPREEAGRYTRSELVEAFERHYRGACDYYPDAVNMSGTYVTLFSGLLEIFGWDMMLIAGGMDPEGFGEVALRYEQWIKQFFDAYAETDIPVMMVHDDIAWTSGPVFHPAWYRKYIFPAYKRLWQPVIDTGKIIVYTSDGTYDMFFDDIVDCGARTLVMEPGNDMEAFANKHGKRHGFIGNADTRVLLSGTKAAIRAEVERCMAIGRGCPGFIMAVGNHIPANTPVENALHYNEAYMELRRRAAKGTTAPSREGNDLMSKHSKMRMPGDSDSG